LKTLFQGSWPLSFPPPFESRGCFWPECWYAFLVETLIFSTLVLPFSTPSWCRFFSSESESPVFLFLRFSPSSDRPSYPFFFSAVNRSVFPFFRRGFSTRLVNPSSDFLWPGSLFPFTGFCPPSGGLKPTSPVRLFRFPNPALCFPRIRVSPFL